jgi:hypothetical protein
VSAAGGFAAIGPAALTTYVEHSGRQIHHFRFQIGNWREHFLPLSLPAGDKLVAARVDGRWIARMPPAVVSDEKVFVNLPALTAANSDPSAGQTEWHTYDIVYISSLPAWKLWTEVPLLSPTLPVPAVTIRRTWRLPSGSAPLHEQRYRCTPSAGPVHRALDSGLPFPLDTWPSFGKWVSDDNWESEQRRRIAEAGAALSALIGSRPTTLAEMLDRLTTEAMADQQVVVDGMALRQAGMTSLSPAPKSVDQRLPPWEAFGLTYVPSPAGPVLTTNRELELWREAARRADRGDASVLSSSLEKAVTDAVAYGQDDRGRFKLATEWLRGSDTPYREIRADSLEAVMGELHAEYWNEWEPLAGTDLESPMIAIRHDVLPGMAVVFACALALSFWRTPARFRIFMLLTWLALAGLSYFWLSRPLQQLAWWPLLAGLATALCWYLASTRRASPPNNASSERSLGTSAVLGLVLAIAVGTGFSNAAVSRADEPVESVVFLIREADREKYSVLATPELFERLQSLVQRSDTASGGAFLVSADYEGKAVGDSIAFKAEFLAYCPGKSPTFLHLPLGDVQLDGETLVDGARMFPVAAKPPLTGYTLRINPTSEPIHRLTLHFRARVNATGDERDSVLTLPSSINSRLTLDLPAESGGVEAVAGDGPIRGRQRTVQLSAGVRLETDLGRLTTPLRLRWSLQRGPARPPQLEARELYLWDVRPEAVKLTALINYKVRHGAASGLELEVPERLEVLSVKTGSETGRPGPGLKSWRVAGAGRARHLSMEFLNPISGDFMTIIQLAPRGALVAGEQLALPVPRVNRSARGFVACQIADLEGNVQTQGLIASGHEREEFSESWRRDVLVDPRQPWLPTYAFFFDRATTGPPSLKLDMNFALPRLQGVQQVEWQIGGDQAECKAVIGLTAPGSDMVLVEWEVPPDFTVASISSSELASWNQTGSRVQAWLDGSRRSAVLQITGWQKLSRLQPSGKMEFRLPCIQLLSTGRVENWIRIKSAIGQSLEEMERFDLSLLPDPQTRPSEQAFYSPHPHYGARFRIRQSLGASEARVLTIAETRGRHLACTTLLALQADRAAPPTVAIEVRNWSGNDVRCNVVEGPAKVMRQEGLEVPGWSLELPPGASGRYRATIECRLALDQVGVAKPMPDIRIRGAIRVESWLAIASTGTLRPDAMSGIEVTPDSPGMWSDPLRRRASSYWRVAAENWNLKLLLVQETAPSPSVQMLLAEQECSIPDGRRWIHESTIWLYHEANTDVTVLMPTGSRLLGLSVDDASMTPLQPAPGRLWVPLPGQAGNRKLRLRWTFEDSSVERPRMQMPQIVGVGDGPALWSAYVPAGYHAARNEDGQNRAWAALPASAASLDLHRAAAQHRLSTILANRLRSGDTSVLVALAGAQQRFYRACRFAEQLLNVGIGNSDASGDGQSPLEWLKRLREDNIQLARQQGFESLRAEAEIQASQYRQTTNNEGNTADRSTSNGYVTGGGTRRDAWSEAFLPRPGIPLHWQGPAGGPPPHLTLVADRVHNTRKAIGLSVVWLILLMAVGLTALFPALGNWLRLFWPEQVALLACLVWQAFGLNLLLVFLILLGVCGRTVSLLQLLARRLRRVTPTPPPTPAV